MDNVLVDFKSGIEQLSLAKQQAFEGRLDEVPGIFSLMDPMPGAIDAFEKLANYYDTYILSTSPWENPTAASEKVLWVKKYLNKSAYKRVILSHHKNLNKGDFLIDDRLKNGVEEFEGKHIHFGQEEFPNWQAVLAYLIKE